MHDLASHLRHCGQEVDFYFWTGNAPARNWWDDLQPVPRQGTALAAALLEDRYDFVFLSHAAFIPMIMPVIGELETIAVYLTQDYESFWAGETYEECMRQSQPYVDLLRKSQIPVMVTSRGLQQLFETQLNRQTLLIPVALSKELPLVTAQRKQGQAGQILMIGNYLLPFKGILDGLDAVELLSREMSVRVFLVSRDVRNRALLDRYTFEIELCSNIDDQCLAGLYAGCDVYCCSSWYEGFGLPAIEAFRHELPVVSTAHLGAVDYAVDGFNLLLARCHDPQDLCKKLKTVLTDPWLADRLASNGKVTARQYSWERTTRAFVENQKILLASRLRPQLLDSVECAYFLQELEADGLFLSHTSYSVYHNARATVAKIARQLMQTGQACDCKDLLQSTGESLRCILQQSRLQNDRIKSLYQRCELLLSLWEDKRLSKVARIMTREFEQDANSPYPALP